MIRKKGLSEIITIVLLVLFVIVGISIVWNYVRPTIEQAGSDSAVLLEKGNLKVKKAVVVELGEMDITLERGRSKANLKDIEVEVVGDSGSQKVTIGSAPKEFETGIFTINYDPLIIDTLKSILVFPVFVINNQVRVGKVEVVFEDIEVQSESSCGDGIMEGSEECDEGGNNGVVCSPTYGGNCNYCDNDCVNVNLIGDFCGDGVKNGPEFCDGADVGTESCAGLGYAGGGTLVCNGDCSNYDTSMCLEGANIMVYYNMDQLGGFGQDRLLDNSGRGHTSDPCGTVSFGECPDVVPGKYGNGLSFSGDDYFVISDSIDFQLTEYTIAVWVNMPSGGGSKVVVARGENNNDKMQWSFEYDDGANPDKMTLWYEESDDTEHKLATSSIIPNNVWVHVAVTRNANNDYSFFVNGVEDAVYLSQVPSVTILQDLNIGTRSSGVDGFPGIENFVGIMDDLKIYDKAMSEGEVQAIM